MLQVVTYKHSGQLESLDFIQDKSSKIEVICPSPVISDSLRNLYRQHPNLETITIYKFLNDHLEELYPENIEMASKSKLLLHLAAIWSIHFSELPDDRFFYLFNVFTDLRSYTKDFSLLEDILSEYDDTERYAIQLFWAYMENQEILDEHRCYFDLAEYFREQEYDSSEEKTYIIQGFPHLSSSQVDLINAISIKNNVYVPLHEDVLGSLSPSSWPVWLDQSLLEKEVPADDSKEPEMISVVEFNKGRLSQTFLNYVDQYQVKESEVLLCEKSLSLEQVNEVSLCSKTFRVRSDLFKERLLDTSKKIEVYLQKVGKVDVDIFADFLKDLAAKAIKKTSKDFFTYKICSLYLKTLEEWSELSDKNTHVNLFEGRIFLFLVELDLPRLYNIPLREGESQNLVMGLESVDQFINSKSNQKFIVASSEYLSMKSTGEKYSCDLQDKLSVLGPLQNQALAYQLIKVRIEELLRNNVILFLERGVEESDPAWNEICSKFSRSSISLNPTLNERPRYYSISQKKTELNTISASKLQTYLDCPRKYFVDHIEKLKIDPEYSHKLTPRDLGIIQHEVIEVICTSAKKIDDVHDVSCLVLERYLSKMRIELKWYQKSSYLLEIKEYALNGLASLLAINKEIPDAELSFEEGIDDEFFRGSIDCIIRSKTYGVAIIDFKRSKSSVPTMKELANLRKIQVFYYLKNMKKFSEYPADIFLYGFLNLSDPNESLLLSSHEGILSVKEISAKGFDENELQEVLQSYESLEFETIEKMKKESLFEAIPTSSSACTYCKISNVCAKGVEHARS